MSTTRHPPSAPTPRDVDPGPVAPVPAATGAGPAAPAPTGAGPVPVVGILLALAMTALGVLALRDGLAGAGAISGQDWIGSRLAAVTELQPATWMLPVGVLAAAAGIALVLVALRPRRRTAVRLRAAPGVFLGARDLARIAVATAADVDGVISAKAAGTPRAVTVMLRTTGAADAAERVRTAVTDRLSDVDPPPRVRVRARPEKSNQ